MNEEQRFQAWLMTKNADGRPVWAPEIHDKTTWREGPMAFFFKAFFQNKGVGRR